MLPVRCYTCGKVLGNLSEKRDKYKNEMTEKEENWLPFFEMHNIKRYCCRRVIMSQVPDANHEKTYTLPSSVSLSTEYISKKFYIAR